jgi:hypothetical protein
MDENEFKYLCKYLFGMNSDFTFNSSAKNNKKVVDKRQRINQLRQLINKSLDEGNKKDFMKYTAELSEYDVEEVTND